MSYEYKLGTTIDDLTLLTALGIIAPPHASYRPFSIAVNLASGIEQGEGFPVVTWHWDVMRQGESDILASYLSGNLSAPVVIRTRLNRLGSGDYTWATYNAVMRWVTGDEDIQSRRSIGLTIEFSHLVLIPEET